jgi:exodeoxyribonuclease V alpha subunit
MLSYLNSIPLKVNIDEDIVEQAINNFPFQLNEQQVNAVRGVISSRVTVLTGGPGTGKSTITKAVVDIFQKSKIHFELLSPTGKATRRMVECTGHNAYTIHKYLHAKSASLEDIELPVVPHDTAIIIDESSMLYILMLAKIVEIAKYTPIRLILIGDQDQLPSVQVGNVLSDIINSGVADVYKLTDIMRQAKDSHIIQYCSDINMGKLIPQCQYSDFEYTEFYDENDLFDELEHCYFDEVGKHGLSQVQIIAPYKKGNLGTLNLNKFISNFNENYRSDLGYDQNDKVMQMRNDYSNNVFNGECGVVSYASDNLIKVSFREDTSEILDGTTPDSDGHVISYDEKNLVDLMLAYASTCHKSQGAEYSVVFVILDDTTCNFLLTRKLLYTAVSRGKKKVYIYSSPGCLSKCIKNISEVPRITKLSWLLQKAKPSSDEFLDIEEVPF